MTERPMTHAPDLASIRACVAARCLLVPEQASALLAERDALRAAGQAMAEAVKAGLGYVPMREAADAWDRALDRTGGEGVNDG